LEWWKVCAFLPGLISGMGVKGTKIIHFSAIFWNS
jgi:hypothetical protein